MSRQDATQLGGAAGDNGDNAVQATPVKQAKGGRLRNWRLRSKLAIVLIIPTLTALVLGGLRTYDRLSVADEFQQTADQVGLAISVTSVVHELQTERTLAVTKTGAQAAQGREALDAQIGKVDQAIAQLRDAAQTLETEDEAARTRYNRGLQRLDVLRPLRAAAKSTPYSDLAVYATYSDVLETVVQLGREVTSAVADREVLRLGTATQAISEAKEFLTKEDAALQIAALRGEFPGDLLDQARDANASGSAATTNFLALASPERRQFYSDTVSGPEVDGRERIRGAAFVQAEGGTPVAVDVERLTKDSTATAAKLRTVESGLLDDLRVQANDAATSTTTTAYIEAAVVLLLVILTLVLMLAVARLLLGPLRVLRSSALDIAYTRLPQTVQRILDDPDPIRASRSAIEPVPINTREEIGEVARSFDAVHEQAVRMAAEQALLRENVNGIFVNLSRRSQRLVERQLGVIDRLEADEQDPDHLASLFELDHLATRLRRNGESLLVLSGAGLSKSVPRPVPAADVIGAAVSEIEQYARVEVGVVPEALVQGRTIHDLVHLLAELLDNATYFSEPDTKVTVRAVATRRDELAIQITDRGVGMSEAQFADANQRLADPPDLDVSVTRRMGLYVVARLAQRHNIEVRLRENEDIEGGVVARIVVPAELLNQRGGPSTMQSSMPRLDAMSDSVPQNWMAESSITQALGSGSYEHTPPPRNQEPPSRPLPERTPSASRPEFAPVDGPLTGPQDDQYDSPEQYERQPEPPAESDGGLRPLDQPISLDDMMSQSPGGSGLFVTPASDTDQPTAYHAATNGNGNGLGAPRGTTPREPAPRETGPREPERAAFEAPPEPPAETPAEAPANETGFGSLALPKRQPSYVPVNTPEPDDGVDTSEPPGTAPDDVPTRRLPIYQSVLSRWFSEDDEQSAGQATPAPAPEPDAGRAEPPVEQPAEPQTRPEGAGVADSWQSASDNGWHAAQALLDAKSEEITPAGLPKRVPNQHLVPGSVGAGSGAGSFSDTSATTTMAATPEQSDQPSIARSATAARSRMAAFQRGYKSGRHALKDDSSQAGEPGAVSVSSSGEESAENGVKE